MYGWFDLECIHLCHDDSTINIVVDIIIIIIIIIWTTAGYQLLHLHIVDPQSNPQNWLD